MSFDFTSLALIATKLLRPRAAADLAPDEDLTGAVSVDELGKAWLDEYYDLRLHTALTLERLNGQRAMPGDDEETITLAR